MHVYVHVYVHVYYSAIGGCVGCYVTVSLTHINYYHYYYYYYNYYYYNYYYYYLCYCYCYYDRGVPLGNLPLVAPTSVALPCCGCVSSPDWSVAVTLHTHTIHPTIYHYYYYHYHHPHFYYYYYYTVLVMCWIYSQHS